MNKHTLKLPGQQIPQPPLQQRSDAPHEEQPNSPTSSPESTAGAFAHWTLNKQIQKTPKMKTNFRYRVCVFMPHYISCVYLQC